MENSRKKPDSVGSIWIIGKNVLMDGVTACLEDQKVPDLVRFDDINVNSVKKLRMEQPILIIFELDTSNSHYLIDLLRQRPDIHLLGIDQDCNQLIVFNSFTRKALTISSLYQIVKEISGGWEQVPRGGINLEKDEMNTC
jgi:hypothetical protein